MANTPKRHHFVPQVYLRYWADEREQVAARRRGQSRAFVAGIKNVGVENDLYGKGEHAAQREQSFSAVEGLWPELHEQILATECRSKEVRERVAGFLSLQRLRTREQLAQEDFVERVTMAIEGKSIDAVAMRAFLIDVWGVSAPSPEEVQGACDYFNVVVKMYGDSDKVDKTLSLDIAAHRDASAGALLDRHWFLRRAARPVLITSDAPVVLWSKRSERDHFQGIGLQDAQEVWFPLDPWHLLVLSKNAGQRGTVDVPVKSMERASAEIASRSFESVFSTLEQRELLQSLELGASKPAMRFNTGPLYESSPTGEDIYKGDVLHIWTQSHD